MEFAATEDDNERLSQESLLLSQETFQTLWRDVKADRETNEISSLLEENAPTLEQSEDGLEEWLSLAHLQLPVLERPTIPVPTNQFITVTPGIPSLDSAGNQVPQVYLPEVTNWPGNYGFEISFAQQEKTTKNAAWTYSVARDKLYVTMGSACPVYVHVKTELPAHSTIRAMAVYLKPEHATLPVTRCLNHASPADPLNNGHPAPAHLIRCDNPYAKYVTLGDTGRHYVIVPYERPSVGANYSPYLYKFMCLGSCVGGLNRRPIKVIFTLEHCHEVLGRQSVEVRICACPGRDRKADEKATCVKQEERQQRESGRNTSKKPVKKKAKPAVDSITRSSEEKVTSSSEEEGHQYCLMIYGRKNYESLKKVSERMRLPPKCIRSTESEKKSVGIQCSLISPSLNQIHAHSKKRVRSKRHPATIDNVSFSMPVRREPTTNVPFTSVVSHKNELLSWWLDKVGLACHLKRLQEHGWENLEQLSHATFQDINQLKLCSEDCDTLWEAIILLRESKQDEVVCSRTGITSSSSQDEDRQISERKRRKTLDTCHIQILANHSVYNDHDYTDGTDN